MLEKNELLSLMKATAKAQYAPARTYSYNGENLTYSALNDTLRTELNEYAGTYADYRENKNMIFKLIEQTVDEILPVNVLNRYNDFAETRVFGQGDKPIFKRKFLGRQRAKQFITRVGLAGIYEVFKLGGPEYFEVPTSAIGGAAQIGFEEFLDGRADFAEVTSIIMEGMDELILREIEKALESCTVQLPVANRVVTAGFEEAGMDRLLAVASAYGEPTIYCDYEFAVKMVPAEGWRSDKMRDEKWEKGYLASYKGHRVVITPQGFTDETNSRKQIDAGYCWIIPSGADTKPVKIAFEGDTIVDEYQNKDRSREIQVYKKVGVGVMMTNNICSYVDTSLTGKFDTLQMFVNA